MIIIGEKINATRKPIAAALEARDADHIIATVAEQAAAGADYLDINGGNPAPAVEVANMQWLADLVQANTDLPLCIDTANPEAMALGLSLAKAKPIVNSISLETERLAALLPVIKDNDCMVFALCMSDEGTPTGADDRAARAEQLIEELTGAGKAVSEIIIDPCFFPVSAEPASAKYVCEAIAEIKSRFPEVHVGGGVSNASYGLPNRRLLNLGMLAMATYHGMDAALVDPCTPDVVSILRASEVLSGAHEWCANYVAAHRAGKL